MAEDLDFGSLGGWGDLSGEYVPGAATTNAKKLQGLLDKAVVVPVDKKKAKKSRESKKRSGDPVQLRDSTGQNRDTKNPPKADKASAAPTSPRAGGSGAAPQKPGDDVSKLLAAAMPQKRSVRFSLPDGEPATGGSTGVATKSQGYRSKAKAAEAAEGAVLKASGGADDANGSSQRPGRNAADKSKGKGKRRAGEPPASASAPSSADVQGELCQSKKAKLSDGGGGGSGDRANAAAPAGEARPPNGDTDANAKAAANRLKREKRKNKSKDERAAGGSVRPTKTRKDKLREKRALARAAAATAEAPDTSGEAGTVPAAATPLSKEEKEVRLKEKLARKWRQRAGVGASGRGDPHGSAGAISEPVPGSSAVASAMPARVLKKARKSAGGSAGADASIKTPLAHGASPGDKPAKVSTSRETEAATAAKLQPRKATGSKSPAAVRQSTHAPQSAPAAQRRAPAEGSSVISKMKARLQGSRFRSLNEQLYTCSGDDALSMMQDEPELFSQYHEGFREQTKGWPKQPVDVATRWVSSLPKSAVVADFGCGDAQLAASVPHTVHSFDLVSTTPGVVACNMADVPIGTGSVDAAVFSLALMGTDYGAFLREAARVLKPKGWLWIAEVRSRFSTAGGKEDFKPFLACLSQLGFKLMQQDAGNKMFVTWVLRKQSDKQVAPEQLRWPPLKACVYKRR